MNNSITVLPNQGILDVILQGCGTLESGMNVMAANNRSISDLPEVGDIIQLADSGIVSDTGALRYLTQNGIVIGTLGNTTEPTLMIVLKPVMQVSPRTTDTPSTTGDYEFNFEAASSFINAYAIPHSTYTANPTVPLNFITEDRYVAGDMPEVHHGMDGSVSGPAYMDNKLISYTCPWVSGRGFMMVWSDMGSGAKTATFTDVNGNSANCAPVVVLGDDSQDVVEFLIADLTVSVVSVSPNAVTLRLIRSHPAAAHIDFATHTMNWTNDAIGGTADPVDPMNDDKTILVLPRGTFTFGVATTYTYGSIIYPASIFTMVVEII